MGMGKCLPAIVEVAGKLKMVKVTDFVDRLIKVSFHALPFNPLHSFIHMTTCICAIDIT
jgi:hypothetical protein